MKYIDAEKLVAEINKRLLAVDIETLGNFGSHRVWAYNDVKDLIESLQQEQPELPGYNKGLLEVKSKVDELYEEASIGLNEYDSGLYNGIAETCMKLRGFIKARLDPDDQSGVDLWKEIYEYFNPHGMALQFDRSKGNTILKPEQLIDFARHFYELGRNARKEE